MPTDEHNHEHWSRLFHARAPVLDLSSRLGAPEHVFANISNNCKADIDFYVFHWKPEGRLMVWFYCCFLLQLLIWSLFFLFSHPLVSPLKASNVEIIYKRIFKKKINESFAKGSPAKIQTEEPIQKFLFRSFFQNYFESGEHNPFFYWGAASICSHVLLYP